MTANITDEEARHYGECLRKIRMQLGAVIFGQDATIELLLTGLAARGHILLEGLPGLGKTELVKALARSLGVHMKRIQFTPDLLPGDITGSPMLEDTPNGRRFVFRQGPLFANIVLADEINRASPKTQSALLEGMQESRVTVMGESHQLPQPFFVLATQNPIELEGTYPLPEAQLDRFLFKLVVLHTSPTVLERIVSEREIGVEPDVSACITERELGELLAAVRRVYLPPAVANYIARLIDATHQEDIAKRLGIRYGASPRAALALAAGARARALMHGRINASFEDIRILAPAVLRHRLLLDYRARVEGSNVDAVIGELLKAVPVHPTEVPPLLQDEVRA